MLRKKGDLVIQTIPFALFEDLSEVLQLMDYSADGVRPYQLEWYNSIFREGFKAKKKPDSKVNNNDQTITEKRIGLTTEELVNLTFDKQNKRFSTKQILEKYVGPLINIGYIDKAQSELDKRSNILYPVITATADTTTTKNRKLFEMDQSSSRLRTRIFVL